MVHVRAEGYFSALQHREFRIYWVGQTVSLLGYWMQQAAQQSVMADLTGSAKTLAMVAVVWSLPMLGLSLGGGVVADRYSRRNILLVTNVALAALACVYGVLMYMNALRLEHIFIMAPILGVILAFDLPATQALTPELVPQRDIANAVAINQATFHGGRLLGPALYGILIHFTSVAMAFFANAISYVAVIYSLVILRPPPRPVRKSESGWRQLREGVRYVHGHPLTRTLVLFTALTTSLVFPFAVMFMALFVQNVLGGTKASFGVVMAASGCGALVGALSLLRMRHELRGRRIVHACVLIAVSLIALSFTTSPWQAAFVMACFSLGTSLGLGLVGTTIQTTVPNELRGRVMGVYSLSFTALMPWSSWLLLGSLADKIGLRHTMVVMALVYLCVSVPLLLHAGLWKIRPTHALP
jgi:MFS family permease